MRSGTKKLFSAVIIVVSMLFFSCVVLETAAHARAGGGRSSGSRSFSGTRSTGGNYNRSTPYQTTDPARRQAAPQQPMNQPGPGRGLMYGVGGMILGGMIGSMLFGRSGYAGTGAAGGGFGFGDIVILLVIAGVLYFVYRKYKARREMQMASAGPATYNSYVSSGEPSYSASSGYDTTRDTRANVQEDPVSRGLRHIAEMDPAFNEDAFCRQAEDMFFKIQGGWTRRDINAITDLLTPQMRDIFQRDIERYRADGRVNHLENIAVRQVEIADAIQDQGQEEVTVRYTASLLDFTTDEAGNVLSGSSTDPVKFIEYWTYARKTGERTWKLTAIAQEQDYR